MFHSLRSRSRRASHPARRRSATAARPTLDALEARDLQAVVAGLAAAKSALVGLYLPSLRPTVHVDQVPRVGMITPALRLDGYGNPGR